MSIVNLRSVMKHILIVSIILTAFLLNGCGASEEATMEETTSAEPTQAEATPAPTKEKPKPMDQALTSFIGEDTEKPVETVKPSPPTNQLAQYEKQIDDLRIENTSLKQRIVKLEQENRSINNRMNEVEAKYSVEKLRADRAEEMLKSSPAVASAEPAKPVVRTKPRPTTSSYVYEDALKAFNARKYDEAFDGFQSIADAGGDDELTIRAKYWLGETYFAKKKYKEALPLFQEALKNPKSEKKADAQFMIAQTYERLGNNAKAKEAYEKVVKEFPMSKNVKRAKERWAKL